MIGAAGRRLERRGAGTPGRGAGMVKLLLICGGILVAGFLPLFIVGTLDPDSNPIGLGLLFVASQFIAGVVFAVGLVVLFIRWLRR